MTRGGLSPSPQRMHWRFHSSQTRCPAVNTGLVSPKKKGRPPSRLVPSSLSNIFSVKGSLKVSVRKSDMKNEKAAEPRESGTALRSAIDSQQRFEVWSLMRMLGWCWNQKRRMEGCDTAAELFPWNDLSDSRANSQVEVRQRSIVRINANKSN